MIFIFVNYIRDMSRNAKRWELLYKHIKKCLITLTEVVTLVEDQFKKSYVFTFNNVLN